MTYIKTTLALLIVFSPVLAYAGMLFFYLDGWAVVAIFAVAAIVAAANWAVRWLVKIL